jgi:hypothetical protein
MLDPAHATRHNIAQILIYQYQRLTRHFGWPPRKKDVDQYSILGSNLYELVFGSWGSFESLMGVKLPVVTTKEEYDALPYGMIFVDQTGTRCKKTF